MAQRIVPLQGPSPHFTALLDAGPQQLVYGGGRLLQSVHVRAIYWGDAWSTDATLSPLLPKIDAFLNWIVTSAPIDQLAEYSTSTQTIGRGLATAGVTVPGAVPTPCSDAAIQTMLHTLLGSEASLGSDAFWIVFFPPGIDVVAANGDKSCAQFCGYHGDVFGVAYGVIPFPTCDGCLTDSRLPFDTITSTTSHEICEAITDPFGDGWVAPNGYEIGDLCAAPTWMLKTLGGYVVQKEWSNTTGGGSCV